MAIQVVTHNGKMPRDGGKRQGYIADRSDGTKILIPILGQAVVLGVAAQQLPTSRTKTDTRPVYWDLRLVRSAFARGLYCPECGSTDLERVDIETADEGQRTVTKCWDCLTLLRRA